ncbi:MAG: MFS transporter [Wolbachia sp.]
MLTLKHRRLPFFMWFFPLSFFAYQFILRLWPGLMMHQIMDQFAIDASHFGVLAAFYYCGYFGMQIPVAILLDRFGTRYIAMLCGCYFGVFTYTNNFYLAVLSRFLIGACSATGFLGVSKVVSKWFLRDQYTRMIGFSFTLGLTGTIYGGKPVGSLIESYE